MREKTAIRSSKSLTDAVISIFEDIVEEAYITTWDINSSRDEVSERLNKIILNIDNLGDLDYGAETIWIKFTNGRIIEFTSSEWAAIRSACVESSYQI